MCIAIEGEGDVQLVPTAVMPLDYDALQSLAIGDDRPVIMHMRASDPVVQGETREGSANVTVPITFHKPLRMYALVDGGWLPPPFVLPPHFMVDRNVVAELRRYRLGLERDGSDATDWWFQLLRGGTTLLSPLLYAFEGSVGRRPTASEFRREFEQGEQEIAAALPDCATVHFADIHYQAAYDQLTALNDRVGRETRFLKEIAPHLAQPVALQRARRFEDMVFQTAKRFELQPTSFVVLATLSCVYEATLDRVARAILNPQAPYADEIAHNAIQDLQSLELLVASRAIEAASWSLCTLDRGMAAFWALLRPRLTGFGSAGITFGVALDRALMPRLNEDGFSRLIARLSAS